MTPQTQPIKREVGVRELHDELSRYMRHVAAGGEVVVTLRGKRVARLSPVSGHDPLMRLRERGLVQEPTRARRRAQGRTRPVPARSVAELVGEQRR
jgi:prevent-host-death family protein